MEFYEAFGGLLQSFDQSTWSLLMSLFTLFCHVKCQFVTCNVHQVISGPEFISILANVPQRISIPRFPRCFLTTLFMVFGKPNLLNHRGVLHFSMYLSLRKVIAIKLIYFSCVCVKVRQVAVAINCDICGLCDRVRQLLNLLLENWWKNIPSFIWVRLTVLAKWSSN